MEASLHVGIAQIKVGVAPTHLHTLGIGSCIVLYLFTENGPFAGCAHMMLPDSGAVRKENLNERKFVDTAVPLLLTTMNLQQLPTENLKAKYAGGAQMFPGDSENVGSQNILAVEKKLKELGIEVVTRDVGGSKGRSAFFNTVTKELKIVRIDAEDIYI